MTRTTAATGVARARDFSNVLQAVRFDFTFDCAFRNEEARADERFVAGPIVARGVAILANRCEQRIAREFRTVFSVPFQIGKVSTQCGGILSDDGCFGSRDIHNPFCQQ